MKTRLLIPISVAVFLAVLYAFFSVELTPGMRSDGTDWAMYVMHTHNIVHRLPYTATRYVFQPESTTEVGANSYPSGYPLILAPFYAIAGVNLRLFKLLNAAFLVLSLWPSYLFARRTLSAGKALVLIVALGTSTLFFLDSDAMGSDAPYQFVSLGVLLLILRIYDKQRNETNPWTWGLLSGLCIAGSYLIRPFGLAFVMAIAGFEFFRQIRKRDTPATLWKRVPFLAAVVIAFLPPLLLNNLLLHHDSSYAYQFALSPGTIARHAAACFGFFSYAFANPISHPFRYLLFVVTLPMVLLAFVRRLREEVGITELYVLVLVTVDCLYWSPSPRYLMPIMPIYMVYMFEGFEMLTRRFPQRVLPVMNAAAVVLLLCAPAANAVLLRADPTDTLVTAPKFEALCAAIRKQTPQNSLVLFWNPRVLGLTTQRFSSGWPAEGGPERMGRYLLRVRPSYVVADKYRAEDRQYMLPALAAGPPRFRAVYENEQFTLFQAE